MSNNIVGYRFKTNIFGQQVLYMEIKTRDICPITIDEGPEYSYFRKDSRQEAETILRKVNRE